MKCSIAKKLKVLLIAALVILIAGFTVLGICGFNNTADFNKSYEISLSITQNHDGSGEYAKGVVESYLDDKGQNYNCYDVQVSENGKVYIYKFDKLENVDETELNTLVNNQLDNKYGAGVYIATVHVDEVIPALLKQVGWITLALGISAVVVFVYLLIVEKLAAALSTLISSVGAGVFFVALMAITRIPAEPFIVAGMATAAVLAGVLSAGTVNRCKEEIRLNEKITKAELTAKVVKDSFLRHILICGLIAIVSIALIIVGPAYLRWLGLQLLLAGVVSTVIAYVCTPVTYTLIKKLK